MSESYSVIYSPEALNDLREIYSYIAFELLVPSTAEGQVNRIRKAIRSLDFMPARNPIVDWEPWKSMGINYKNLSDEEFRWLIRILKKSKKMGTPISQRKKR